MDVTMGPRFFQRLHFSSDVQKCLFIQSEISQIKTHVVNLLPFPPDIMRRSTWNCQSWQQTWRIFLKSVKIALLVDVIALTFSLKSCFFCYAGLSKSCCAAARKWLWNRPFNPTNTFLNRNISNQILKRGITVTVCDHNTRLQGKFIVIF